MKSKFFVFILIVFFPALSVSAQDAPSTILDKPVKVILWKITDGFPDIPVIISYKKDVFKFDTQGMDHRDFSIKIFKDHTGWKDNYLFVSQSCGGCNAFRGQRERVYKIKNNHLIQIGIVRGSDEDFN